MEDVQRSLRRGKEERWDAGRARGCRMSEGCLSLVPEPEQQWQCWHWGALGEMKAWRALAKRTSKTWTMYPS